MTTAQLITRVGQYLAYDLDSFYGASPTDAQVVATLNEALREIAKAAFLVEPSIALTMVDGTSTYSLRSTSTVAKKVDQVLRVAINHYPLKTYDGKRRGLWTFTDLEEYAPNWRDADNGTPRAAVQMGDKLILYPPPTATVVSDGNNYVTGTKLPADLSENATSASPDIPEELHEPLAKLAAAKSADPNATEGHQDARIARLYQQAMGAANEVGRQNRKAWNTPSSGSREAPYIRI
jgi:hypothetical protein